MKAKSLMAMGVLSLVMAFSQAAQAEPSDAPQNYMSNEEKREMTSLCAGVDTRAEAAPCLEAFHRAASVQTRNILESLQAEGLRQADVMSEFDGNCLEDTQPFVDSGKSPEEYLRNVQYCLTAATHAADDHEVSYDEGQAGFLISTMRRLRRLNLD